MNFQCFLLPQCNHGQADGEVIRMQVLGCGAQVGGQ